LEVGQKISLRALMLDRFKDGALSSVRVGRSVFLLSFLVLLGPFVLIKLLNGFEVLRARSAFPAGDHRHRNV
jgi:hypothetical protein